jgi:hypothetical protein
MMAMTRERRLLIEQDGAGSLERLVRQRLSALSRQCKSVRDKVLIANTLLVLDEAVAEWKRERGLPT